MWKTLLLLVAASAAQADLVQIQPLVPGPSVTRPVSQLFHQERIVGGEEATPGQFPHQVGIWVTVSRGKAFCGGSILSEHIVITAAHCAEDAQKFDIVAGAHEIRKDGTHYQATKAVVHPLFKSDGFVSNDIALLYVAEGIKFSEKVKPIRLPSDAQNIFFKARVTLSGWGLQHDSDKYIAPTLRFVNSRVVINNVCSTRFSFSYVHRTNICVAGLGEKGPCQGDSGGPLVTYESDGKPTLIGLTSFGGSSCEQSSPSVFTRITSYIDWINASIKELGQ